MKRILVVSADWKFRALVRAELRERGYDARGCESLEDVEAQPGANFDTASLLILDATAEDVVTVGKSVKKWADDLPVLVVVSAMFQETEAPPNVTLLKHPVRVGDIVTRVLERVGPPA